LLTDLSADCENLPVEGVSGTCYAHKVDRIITLLHLLNVHVYVFLSEHSLFVDRSCNLCVSQGMSQAAGYIYKKLLNDGILNQAFTIAPVRALTFPLSDKVH
jgi:hypothetical protein